MSCTSCFKHCISGIELDWSTSTRGLGITIDNNLKFEQHISKMVHNASVRANLIIRSFVSRDPAILVKAFITYVRLLLEYCTPVWSPHTLGLIRKIESVQKKFTRKLYGFAKLDYVSRIDMLNLELLHVIRLKQDLLWCYNILHGNVAVDSAKFFSLFQYQRTRGHPYKIYKQPCRLNVSLYSFANRIIDIWNNLQFEIVCVSSIAAFKRNLNTLALRLSF